MASYQLVCSVVRPSNPTEACHVANFQEKIAQHSSTVICDVCITSSRGDRTSGEAEMQDSRSGALSDDCLLFALVAKTTARFSGAEEFGSQIELPRYWCNMCSFDTPSKPCLLQHLVDQHCFMCPVCPFAAFTRFAVAQHGVREHPAFRKEMFRQKLKGLQINRYIFQDLFEPVRIAPRPPKRRSEACSESSVDKEPAKQMRMSGSDCHDREQCTDTSHCEGSSSSGTQQILSTDENLSGETASDTNFDLCGRSASRLLAVLASSANLYNEGRSVGENIVSSSGMDADSGGDVGSVSCADTSKAPGSTSPPLPVMEAENKAEGKASAVEIKQEVVWSAESSFQVDGLSRSNGNSPSGGMSSQLIQAISFDSGIHVKLEKDIESQGLLEQVQSVTHFPSFPSHSGQMANTEQDTCDSGVSCHAHPSASPPLSCIRVENLQRQFEESVRSIDMFNYPDQPQGSLTSPSWPERIKLSGSKPHTDGKLSGLPISSRQSPQNSVSFDKRERHFTTQPAVANFLLEKPLDKSLRDSSQNSRSSSPGITNMLRYLLTRAQVSDEKGSLNGSGTRHLQYLPTDQSLRDHRARPSASSSITSHSPVGPPCNSAESNLSKRVPAFLQPSVPHRKLPERSSYNLLSSLLTKDTSSIQEGFYQSTRNPLPVSQGQEPGKKTELVVSRQEAGIKGSEDCLVVSQNTSGQVQAPAIQTPGQRQSALDIGQNLASLLSHEQSSPGASLEISDSLSSVSSMRVRDILKLPGINMPHLQLLLTASQLKSLHPQKEQSLHMEKKQLLESQKELAKKSRPLNLSLTVPLTSVQRKLDSFKSYSNMSLRDILTMTTSSNLDLAKVCALSSKEDSENRDADKEIREDLKNEGLNEQIKEEDESEVVWECEFCDFSGAEKSIVTSHRESQHADLLDTSYQTEQSLAPWQKSLCSSDHGCPSGLPEIGNKQEEGVGENKGGYGAESFCPSRQFERLEAVVGGAETISSRNYQYLDSETGDSFGDVESLSEPSSEADNPEDTNCITPKSLQQTDNCEIQSSLETDVKNDTFPQSRREKKSKWRKERKSRPVQFDRTSNPKSKDSLLTLKSKRTLHPYACLYCPLNASSLKLIKDHIRYSNCAVPHFFKAEVHQCSIPQFSSMFICPREECHFTNTSPQRFLEHVLPCQGHIFAAGIVVLKVLTASLQQKASVSGPYLCSVASCCFASAELMVMRRHLFGHIMQMHGMLMVLMRTITSAITDIHADCVDWCWCPFLCFMCSRGMSSFSAAQVHMQNEHSSLITGIFHLEMNRETACPGELHPGPGAGPRVSLCCLRCEQTMAQLGQWLCHTCLAQDATPSAKDTSDGCASKHETNLSTMLWARLLQPETSDTTDNAVLNALSLQLNEWPWYIENVAGISATKISESDSRRKAKEQVPTISRILTENTSVSQLVLPLMSAKTVDRRECSEMSPNSLNVQQAKVPSKHQDPSVRSDPANQRAWFDNSCPLAEINAQTKQRIQDLLSNSSPSSHPLKRQSLEADADCVVECDVCEEVVPEKQWKKHGCFHQAIERVRWQRMPADSLQSKTSFLPVAEGQNARSKNVLSTSDSFAIHRNTAHTMRMGHLQQSDSCGASKDFIWSDSSSFSSTPESENNTESALMPVTRSVRPKVLPRPESEDERHSLSPGGHISQKTNLEKDEDNKWQVASCSEAVPQPVPHHVSQPSISPATAVQCSVFPSVNLPDHRAGSCSVQAAEADTADIVTWLHQQGSCVMHVLDNVMDCVDNKQQL